MRFLKIIRHPAAILVAAIAVLATPALLYAHARLLKSAPAANDSLEVAPTSISLWFSERPELRFTTVQLLDSAGASIALGKPAAVDPNGVFLPITTPLAGGSYSVVWRTAASDGHATNGKFSFRVIAPRKTPAPAPTPGATIQPVAPSPKSFSATSQPPQPQITPPEVRWAEFLGALVLIGAAVFQLTVLPKTDWPEDFVRDAGRRAQRLALAALLVFAVTTAVRLVLQSQLVTFSASTMSAVVVVVRDTRWGHGWATGAVGAVLAFFGLLAARSIRGWHLVALGVVLICVSEALTGHAAAVQHPALAVAADVTHVLGAGAWIGTLAVMLAIGLPALHRMDAPAAARAGSSLTRAYHTSAVDGVILVVASGVTAAFLRLPAFNALWTTDYGSWLFRKIVFVLFALAFGAYHWRRVVTTEWTHDTRRTFRRTALAEFVVGLVIIGFTSILVSTQLPT